MNTDKEYHILEVVVLVSGGYYWFVYCFIAIAQYAYIMDIHLGFWIETLTMGRQGTVMGAYYDRV